MVRVFRAIFLLAAFLVAVVAILAVALNFYLGLSSAAPRVRAFVSGIAGAPVAFQGVSVNVLKGASFMALRIDNPASPGEPVLLSALSASATYAPLALPQHRFLLRQITFERPVLALSEAANGDFLLPPPLAAPAPALAAYALDVKSLNLHNGTLRALDRLGQPSLTVEGIEHGGRLERSGGAVKAAGQFTATALALGPLRIGNVDGAYSFEKGVLKITKLIGTSHHGQWTGSAQFDTGVSGVPCDFQVQASALDLNELLKAVAGRPDLVSGALTLSLSARGPFGFAPEMTGQGSFEIRNGQLIRVDFIQQLAAALGLKELSEPDFTVCQGDFTLEQGSLQLTDFSLAAANFSLTGTGAIRLDGTADLKLVLTFQPDLAKRLPPAVAAQLAAAPDGSGARSIPFTLTGPLDHPSSDLFQRLGATPPPAAAP